MKYDRFEDLPVWKAAINLAIQIHCMTAKVPFRGRFSLRDQIERAAVSVSNNIAEGFERGTKKEFVQFLNIAKGSNGEVRSQLYAALDQEYVSEKDFNAMRDAAICLARRLSSLIRYLESYRSNSRVRKAGKC